MKKNFYAVLEPLINMILTGSDNPLTGIEKIKLCPGFIEASEVFQQGESEDYDIYILSILEPFFNNADSESRSDIVKIFLENTIVLNVGIMITSLTKKKLHENDIPNNLEILQNYDYNGVAHFALYMALFYYIDNVLKVKSVDGYISRQTYEECLRFNSRARMTEDFAEMMI